MTAFIIVYLFALIVLVKWSKYKILCNELFWLGTFWSLIIGVYICSGISFNSYGLSFELLFFLTLCLGSLLVGRRKGMTSPLILPTLQIRKRRLYYFSLLGVLGIIIYIIDILRLNGLSAIIFREAGMKTELEISLIGTIGSLFVSLLLVIGAYLVADKIRNSNSISIVGVFMMFLYTLPCMMHSGRETILFVIITMISLYGYKKMLKTQKNGIIKFKTLMIRTFLLLVGSLIIFLFYSISQDRFTEGLSNVFLESHDLPSKTVDEAQSWGELKFLYVNFLSYFCHQIPFLDFVLKEYDGPYMFGVYELNIISRRLPESLGLNYLTVYDELNRLYQRNHTDFGTGWQTVLGSFIVDFGRIGAVFVCFFCGLFMGKVRKQFKKTLDARYAVMVSLLCMSSFSTIQLGPFYQNMIYGAYFWWIILFYWGSKSKLHEAI